MTKVRGVNLGGWLVLERWITPQLFEGTNAQDEYTFMQTNRARTKLREHQKNFIREEDFKWLAKNGINAVRIPVGHWVFDGDTPYVSCIGRLDWAFRMAEKYKIAILISMHGAPGSQNGRDHSGRIGSVEWYQSTSHREATIQVLERFARRYRESPAFWGLQLLNEPRIGLFQWKLRDFYNEAYQRIVAIVWPTTQIVFHDAFTPRLMSGAVWTHDDRPVVMDIHWYHFLMPLWRYMPISWYVRLILRPRRHLLRKLKRWQGVIIGEWGAVIATETFRRYPKEKHERMMDEFAAEQLRVYEEADGWFYWTYKTEGRGIWNFRSMIEDQRITLPLRRE